MDTFYTNEAAFDAALQTSGEQPTTTSLADVPTMDYSTSAGYTTGGVNFVGNEQGGYRLSTTAAGFAGINADYPTGSIQGSGPSDQFYGVSNGNVAVTPSANTYGLGFNLFTVQSGDYSGDVSDTVSLTVADTQGNVATGSGITAQARSYTASSPSGFLGVISDTPISSATLTGSTANDNIDIAQVTSAGGTAATPAPSTPTISGTSASSTASEAPVAPFAGVTLGDTSPNAADTVTIQLSNGGTGGTLSGGGLSGGTGGVYSLAPADPATLTSELDRLSFVTINTVPNNQSTTTFTITDQNASGSVTDSNTSVTDTSGAGPGTPTPTPNPPSSADAVQITSTAINAQGQVVITGSASGNNGTASIILSGQVDGGPLTTLPADVTYSGAENQNGDFTATYNLGENNLTDVTATLNDREGGSFTQALPESFSGIPGHAGVTTYSDDGSQVLSQSNVRRNGSQAVNVEAPGLTLQSNDFDTFNNNHHQNTNFVFNSGFGIDVIQGFQLGGAGHDTLELPASDFTNLADVLRHTGDVQGSAFITDPKTGDAIRLAGVSTAELKAHPKDIAFHG